MLKDVAYKSTNNTIEILLFQQNCYNTFENPYTIFCWSLIDIIAFTTHKPLICNINFEYNQIPLYIVLWVIYRIQHIIKKMKINPQYQHLIKSNTIYSCIWEYTFPISHFSSHQIYIKSTAIHFANTYTYLHSMKIPLKTLYITSL